jgi:hypothetical protein
VLATALYQALPPDEELSGRPGGGRKLLAFSDSRQAAAFFAPYLESSHALVLRRRLILDGLARATAHDPDCTVDDLIEETAAAAARAGVFTRRESRQGRRREAARWVLRELVALDERQSLEGLGLLRVGLGIDPSWRPPAPLLDLGLSASECLALFTELLRTLRLQGALMMPEDVDPADEIFDPRRGPVYVRGDGAEAKLKVLSWLPTRGVNKRLDYLRRLLAALGQQGAAPGPRGVPATRGPRPIRVPCWPGAGGRSPPPPMAGCARWRCPGWARSTRSITPGSRCPQAARPGDARCAGGLPRPGCAGYAPPWAAPGNSSPGASAASPAKATASPANLAATAKTATTAPCTSRPRRCR